jgi:hypothetical protein
VPVLSEREPSEAELVASRELTDRYRTALDGHYPR